MSKSDYTVIKGTFHIFYPDSPNQGPEPDGDTVTFLPDDSILLSELGENKIHINKRGMVSIRFEAIDALETHFSAKGVGVVHQQQELAYEARDYMLAKLGFNHVVYSKTNPNRVKSADSYKMEGFIIANQVDCYGRVIAFVFSGTTEKKDGEKIDMDFKLFQESANGCLLMEGLVYPAFYSSLSTELAQEAAETCKILRSNKIGLWAVEDVNKSKAKRIDNIECLEKLVLFPKLFRRLAVYFGQGVRGLDGFIDWLRGNPDNSDDQVRLPNGETVNLHTVFEVTEGEIKLKYHPEDIIIITK